MSESPKPAAVVEPAVSQAVVEQPAELALQLFVIPRGKDVKPDYVLATSIEKAREGSAAFFGPKAVVSKVGSLMPAIGHRVLVQVQDRESKPDHLGFVMGEWSKEHLKAIGS